MLPSNSRRSPSTSDRHSNGARSPYDEIRIGNDDDASNSEEEDLEEREPLMSHDSADLTAHVLSPSNTAAMMRHNVRSGLKSKRGCTDAWVLLVFIAYWVGMVVLGIFAFTRESNAGFAKYIQDGVDFEGHACEQKEFVYFPDFRANPDFGICVSSCPNTTGAVLEVALPLATGKPTTNGTREREIVKFTTYETQVWTYVCAPASIQKEAVMITQMQDTIGRFVGALGESWQTIFIMCGIALSTAAFYLVFIRYCGCFTVFISAFGIETLLVYSSYRLLKASADPFIYATDPSMKSSLQICAVIMTCSAVLFFVMAINMFPRLMLAATFITHASKALMQLKKLLFLPFLGYIVLMLLFWWAIIVTVSLFGAGEVTNRVATISATSPASIQVETRSFQTNTHLRWMFLYHLWGIYWTSAAVLAVGEMITATAVSIWYFSPDDKVTSRKIIRIVKYPVSYAVQSTVRFHLGTVLLSSATVTPVAYIRSFFQYIDNKNEFDGNVVTETVSKLCCCCKCCFNNCLKYITKEGMYITAIQGTNFYPSAKLASTLIDSNLLRVGALSQIGNAAVLLGKLIICAATCFTAWFLLDNVSSPVLPSIAVALFSYGVAHAFMLIYETSINMLLLCFTLDENMHGGRGNSAFAQAMLVRSVNDHLRPKWQTHL